MDPRVLSGLRKKRSHVKGLITKQGGRIAEVERKEPGQERNRAVEELQEKLKSLADEFSKVHYEVLDCIDEKDESSLEREQEVYNTCDDQITLCLSRLKNIPCDHTSAENKVVRTTNTKLRMLKGKLEAIFSSIDHVDVDKVDEFISVTAKELEAHRASLCELEETIIAGST
jgi:sugar-specific transcriptional regulator TrmB